MTHHAVRLDSLPAGLVFPPALAQRVYFDHQTQRLVFRGFMYKSDYDRLAQLDSSVACRRAIQLAFTAPPVPAAT
jgi:hypothetical protein